jgi:hypothetical protein
MQRDDVEDSAPTVGDASQTEMDLASMVSILQVG